MKKILFACAIVAASFSANAQDAKTLQVTAGIRPSFPIGDLGDATSFGIGAEVGVEKMFSDKFSGVASIGYNYFSGKEQDLGGGTKMKINYSTLPILVGARVYPSPNFFVGAKIGYGSLAAKADGYSVSTSGFAYEPQIGFNGPKVQAALGYQVISKDGSAAAIGLTVAYKF